MRLTDFPILEEIKEEYTKSRHDGNSRNEAVKQLMGSYQDEITQGYEDDGLLFWVGLADAQYACRELSQEVAEQGLAAIEKITHTDWNVTPSDLERRRKHYACAPMPERKGFQPSRKYRCTWQLGDTFAYRLSGPDAEANGLTGRYVLLRKVDELEFGDGRLLPVVTLTFWDEQSLPTNSLEFQRLPLYRMESGRGMTPASLYEYRAELLLTSRKKLDKLSLLFLGNFQNVKMPDDELIIRHPGFVMMLSPERLDLECCIWWKNRHRYNS